jgi:hypothetical protein
VCGGGMHSGYPMTSFKLKEGFDTYKAPVTSFSQPAWVGDTRIDPKEVLRTLTSITLSVYWDQECRPTGGMVIVDNLVFENSRTCSVFCFATRCVHCATTPASSRLPSRSSPSRSAPLQPSTRGPWPRAAADSVCR